MTAHATETVEVTRADMDRVVVVEPDGELRLAGRPGVVLPSAGRVIVCRLRERAGATGAKCGFSYAE